MALRPSTTLPNQTDAVGPLAWIGLFLLLVPWLVRATSGATNLPAWDLDPTAFSALNNSLTPAGSLLCDGISMLGSAMLLLWAGRRGIAINPPIILLAMIGAAAVVLHGWFLGPVHGHLGNQRIGAAWMSAIFGAAALWHAAQVLSVRRLAAGAMFGLIVVLAIYGAVQVFYQHSQTVADFKADPDRFLAAHGWPKGSPMEKSFARRLVQPEAIGWFGLSNVYATFAASALVFGASLIVAKRRLRTTAWMMLVGFTLTSALALALSFSKGGVLAMAVGASVATALCWLARCTSWSTTLRRRLAGAIGLAAIAGPIALILLRGQIGERIGELSLLFRWFYIQAALRIFGEHPSIGVGPDGFQRAFTIAKPALCPEEVSSPHGVVFDWTATLGALGVAWVCVLARMAWHATAAPLVAQESTEPSLSRSDLRALIAIPVGATLLATWIESSFITPELALTRVGGVCLWCVAAWAIAQTLDRSVGARIALAGAAVVLIAHGQIDVAGSLASSVGLWFGLIAVAAAPDAALLTQPVRRLRVGHVLASAAFAAAAALTLFTCWRFVRAWERELATAAESVQPLAEFSERLASLKSPQTTSESPQAIVRDLGRALGRTVPASPEGVRAAFAELERRVLPAASQQLEDAFNIEPSDRRPLREASRLHLRLAEQAAEEKHEAELLHQINLAIAVMRMEPSTTGAPPPTASDWHWMASVHEHAADLTRDPSHLASAITARKQIVSLDPYSLENAKRLVKDYRNIGDGAEVRAWAAKCLELNEYMRLDRATRGLSDAELRELTNLAGGQ